VCRPYLAFPQPGGRFIVDTEASNVGIEGVLSQVKERQKSIRAYYSKTLNKLERNYLVTRLATVTTMEHFHKYLYGQEFNLRPDHTALTWFMRFKNLEGQIAYWIRQEYNVISEHRQGRSTKMPMAFHDYLAKMSVPTAKKSMRRQMSNKYELLQL
jgi:hypothetical protein